MVTAKGPDLVKMIIDEKLVKKRVRVRLYELGKQHPSLALAGRLFTASMQAHVRSQILHELGDDTQPTPHRTIQEEVSRASYDKASYPNLTEEEYLKLVWFQDNRCAICKITATALTVLTGRLRLVLDCEHPSGKIRGLLCYKCNGRVDLRKRSLEVQQYLASTPAFRCSDNSSR